MNSIPMYVLLDALAALTASHARLMDQNSPDPYMAVLKAKLQLEYYLSKLREVEVTA